MALFYRCEGCGNFVTFIGEKTACTPKCCGTPMTELKANTSDAAHEKHVPEVMIDGNRVTVQVGSVEHPMAEEHYIQWIYLETAKGGQMRYLAPGEQPKAEFVTDDAPIAVYAYCNLHGLWKNEL
ncbi:MAG: desulfoferrodoxin family protein [Eubacterium sp.]|nr:desulfoferrodoxin family protein [Eubacterium sp.]